MSEITTVFADNIIFHVCENQEVAQVVAKDIVDRHGDHNLEVKKSPNQDEIHYDLGGAIMMAWKAREIRVGDLVFSFWPHQVDSVLFQLRKLLKEKVRCPDTIPFIKLFGAWNAICLSEQTAKQIVACIEADFDQIVSQCKDDIEQFESALDQIRKDPHVNIHVEPPPKKEEVQ